MIQTSFALLFIVTLEQYHVQYYWSRKVNYGGIHSHIGLYTWVSYACTNTIIASQVLHVQIVPTEMAY